MNAPGRRAIHVLPTVIGVVLTLTVAASFTDPANDLFDRASTPLAALAIAVALQIRGLPALDPRDQPMLVFFRSANVALVVGGLAAAVIGPALDDEARRLAAGALAGGFMAAILMMVGTGIERGLVESERRE